MPKDLKGVNMKKVLILIIVCLISACNKPADNTAKNTNNNIVKVENKQEEINKEDLSNKLIDAVKENNLQLVRELIAQGADVNLLVFDKTTGKDINDPYAQYKETPLMIASKNGNLEIVKELLSAGAKVDQILPINTERELMPSENQTALEMACQEDNIEVVKILAEAGANARSVILCACKIGYEDLLKIALQNKPNLNFTTGEGGVSPLIMAAEKGYENIVKALLDSGADANYTDPFDTDYTALKAAKDYPNTVELLKSYGAKE